MKIHQHNKLGLFGKKAMIKCCFYHFLSQQCNKNIYSMFFKVHISSHRKGVRSSKQVVTVRLFVIAYFAFYKFSEAFYFGKFNYGLAYAFLTVLIWRPFTISSFCWIAADIYMPLSSL